MINTIKKHLAAVMTSQKQRRLLLLEDVKELLDVTQAIADSWKRYINDNYTRGRRKSRYVMPNIKIRKEQVPAFEEAYYAGMSDGAKSILPLVRGLLVQVSDE